MKRHLKTILTVAAILLIGLWILDKIPFHKEMNQEIPAYLYENGVAVGEMTVSIEGEKSRYLLTQPNDFYGKFEIPLMEETGRDDLEARIQWNKKDNVQRLHYFQSGMVFLSEEEVGIVNYLLINEAMTEFAILLTDGRVIATSDALYALCAAHISYDSDTGTTTITAVNELPKLD
ncbi:MAG: hypothetical protein RRY97_05090 [Oscillibacter sp.]